MNDPRGIFLPVQRLLLASDLSIRSDRALQRTIELAQTWRGRVDVVTVMEGPREPDQVFRWMTRDGVDGGNDLARRQVRKDFAGSGLDVCLHLTRGNLASAIRDVAAARHSQFVIAGTTRSATLWQRIVGSPTQRLSHQLATPLLAVRNKVYGNYKHIVIAADFSKSFPHLMDTARRFFPGRALTLYHARPRSPSAIAAPPRTVDTMAYYRAGKAGDPFLTNCELLATGRDYLRVVIEEKPLVPGLGSYVRRHDVDLVVVGTRLRAGLSIGVVGSVTDSLLRGTPCDVLLVPDVPPDSPI